VLLRREDVPQRALDRAALVQGGRPGRLEGELRDLDRQLGGMNAAQSHPAQLPRTRRPAGAEHRPDLAMGFHH